MQVYQRLVNWFVPVIGKVTWQKLFAKFHGGRQYLLTHEDKWAIRNTLSKHYCICLTRRHSHLSTYATAFAHFIKTGRWGYWSHVLMNCEQDVTKNADFRLVEATGVGCHESTFNEVFNVDGAMLRIPEGFTLAEWTKVIDAMIDQEGKKYDMLFNFLDDSEISCIEAIYNALKTIPDSVAFIELDKLLKRYKVLTPQMLADCKGFQTIYVATYKA